jgi:hypothetical protein
MDKTYTKKQQGYNEHVSPQLKKLKTDIYSLESINISNELLKKEINSIKLLIASIEYDIKHMHELDKVDEVDEVDELDELNNPIK